MNLASVQNYDVTTATSVKNYLTFFQSCVRQVQSQRTVWLWTTRGLMTVLMLKDDLQKGKPVAKVDSHTPLGYAKSITNDGNTDCVETACCSQSCYAIQWTMHSVVHGLAPSNISAIVTPVTDIPYWTRHRSMQKGELNIPSACVGFCLW